MGQHQLFNGEAKYTIGSFGCSVYLYFHGLLSSIKMIMK